MEVLSCAIPPKSCVSIAQVKPSSSIVSLVSSSVSLLAAVPPSLALNYNDFVTKAGETAISNNAVSGSFDFASVAPSAVVALAGVAVVVPLLALNRKQSFGSASPSAAFTALSDESAVLLDIRAPQDVKATGSPNLKSLRKKPLQVAYISGEDESFVSKVVSKCREPESTTIYILDDGSKEAMAVAKLLSKSGFAKAFAITGGAEAWQESELPWVEPFRGFNLNLGGLKNLFSGAAENPNLVPTTLGAAAAAGIGVAVFTEAETVLQLLGSAAFIQIFARKFMFADDREKTMKEIQTFLDTKVAPKEFADELKEVGRVLLPRDGESEKKSKVETMTPAAATSATTVAADQQVNQALN